MKDWSRRNLLRASAGVAVGAAVAVPMTALSGSAAAAERSAPSGFAGLSDSADSADSADGIGSVGVGPVMFCVHDAQRGEVSILHGTNEVIVTDRQLVNRILQASGVS